MKLRLLGDTLRLRLKRSEIERLAGLGVVEEVVRFSAGTFRYALVLDEKVATPTAELSDGGIRVRLPRREGLEWCRSDVVTLAGNEGTPAILIERDFVRSAVQEPDDFDRFTNPRSGRVPPPGPDL